MMKYWFLVCCFLLTLNAFSQDPGQLHDKALEKFNSNKYKEALGLINKAIDLSPKNIDYYLLRSNINISLGNLEEGFDDINTSIKIDPQNYKGYERRGCFFNLIKEADKSILDYSTALKYAKEDSAKINCLIGRSGSKMLKQDFSSCIEDCKEILKIDSMNTAGLNNWAMSLDHLGQGEEAINMLKRIITIDSTIAYAYMNIGFKLSNMGRYKESIPYFDKTLKLNPEMAYTYNNRGYAKFMLNDYVGALEDINKSIKMDPTNSYAFYNRGLVFLGQGKKSKACEDWDQALRLGFTKMYGKNVEDLIKANCL